MLDLDAIKARLAAATPGPWEEEREGGGYPTGVVYGPDCTVTSCDSEPGTLHQCTNAIFIANAPSDIAALVAEVERLNESTMTISWTERATEEACGVSVGLDPLSDVTWTSFYVGVEIRAFFVCLSQWERRVALAEVERLRAARVEPSPEERAAYRRGLADGVAMAKEHAEIDYGRGYIPSADLVWTYVDAALDEATR